MVLYRFVDVIKNDGLLSKQWAGTDAEIRAALAPIISMYP